MTAEIPLTKGFVALVDDEDCVRVLAAGSWCALPRANTTYAMKAVRRSDGSKTTTRLHNFLTGWQFVDHINGNGLDNRRANLRPATQAENNRNVGVRRNNSCGFKGVWWDRKCCAWRAEITADAIKRRLGRFESARTAALAYDAAAVELHGEFAYLNFPEGTAA